jgi:hypothetical protein
MVKNSEDAERANWKLGGVEAKENKILALGVVSNEGTDFGFPLLHKGLTAILDYRVKEFRGLVVGTAKVTNQEFRNSLGCKVCVVFLPGVIGGE